ncbi:52 kDa repressor of the inhibitor of the protein kinase-like [Montipora capricornis]|uniref:52 kDa repressor of the inhibitor of the protein kinase-like n=1 Tax=Montipora capricornis TaxID=246305 RepID=UPI0035F1BA62
MASKPQEILARLEYISPNRKGILSEKLSESAGHDLLADSGLSAGTEDDQCEDVIALRANKNRYHLPTFSDTRWLSRVDSISTLLSNYEAVHEAPLMKCVFSHRQWTTAVICQYILAFTRSLSVVLQSKECDLVLAHKDARNLVAAIQSQRSDERFHLLYSRATASKVGVLRTKPRTVNRQVNRANANVGGDIEVHYKVNFYYPFIDHVIQHLNDRFPEEIKGVLLASFLIPSKLHLLDETVVAKIEQSSGDELPNNAEFGQEVLRWNMTNNNNNSDAKKIQSLQHTVIHCNGSFYPNISTVLQLLLTLPVGSSSCERSFSSLRRLKTWSRTSMANARLNGLALAYIHKPTEIDSSSVLKRWDASGHRRIALAFSKE